MNSSLLWMFILLFIAAVIIILSFRGGLFGSSQKPEKENRKTGVPKSNCPICNSPLYQGENVISRVYRGSDESDQACTIMGCPHCYPAVEKGVKRICPVCRKEIPVEGHLDAHLFLRDTGKRHVHITGCTECHKKK